MKRILSIALIVVLALSGIAAGSSFLDKAKEYLDKDKKKSDQGAPAAQGGGTAHDERTVSDGLKQALTVGTGKAVELVSKQDGYFANPKIKVPLPEKVQKAEKMLRKVGLSKQVDEFVLTMNRAAEKAAPVAKDIFIGAVKEMLS